MFYKKNKGYIGLTQTGLKDFARTPAPSYIERLDDARVASLVFFKDNICATRINEEKTLKIKFQPPGDRSS